MIPIFYSIFVYTSKNSVYPNCFAIFIFLQTEENDIPVFEKGFVTKAR